MNFKNFIVDSVKPLCSLAPMLVFFTNILTSCGTKEAPKQVAYDGPLKQLVNITHYYTEKEKLKTILKAAKLNEFQNGDREFPEGIYIEFYDATGKMTSTLQANTAYYFKEEDKWRGRGKVEVKNLEKGQHLATEELFWKPDTKKIFTDKFVTITDNEDVLYGTGLTANQDLSDYRLKNTSGNFHANE